VAADPAADRVRAFAAPAYSVLEAGIPRCVAVRFPLRDVRPPRRSLYGDGNSRGAGRDVKMRNCCARCAWALSCWKLRIGPSEKIFGVVFGASTLALVTSSVDPWLMGLATLPLRANKWVRRSSLDLAPSAIARTRLSRLNKTNPPAENCRAIHHGRFARDEKVSGQRWSLPAAAPQQ